MYFENFTKEDLTRLDTLNFETNSVDESYNSELDLTLVKINGDWYSVMEESEGDVIERDGNYYALSPTWWMHFDFAGFEKEFSQALQNTEETDDFVDNFDASEYAL